MEKVREFFSPTGVLSRSSNFEYRVQQQDMAGAVARALNEREHLLVEAGTGVGKSFGYLIPSILFALDQKKKAIISTHTINLQEQLIAKDLPVLAEALRPLQFNYMMLKGRQNYLCTRRLRRALQQADSLFTSPEIAELKRIQESLGIARNVLSSRLQRLVDEDILERRAYQENPPRHEYFLTEKGLELWPALIALLNWGDRYSAGPEGPSRVIVHKECGGAVSERGICEECGKILTARDARQVPGRGANPGLAPSAQKSPCTP